MKISTVVAAAGPVAVIVAAGLAIPATASAHTAATTMKFVSVTNKQTAFSKDTNAQEDVDRSSAGKLLGYDELQVTFDPVTESGHGRVVVNLAGGFITSSLYFHKDQITGTIVGGTGDYQGITGTLVAKNLNKAGTRTAVTLTYTK